MSVADINANSSLGAHDHRVVRKGKHKVITKRHMITKRKSVPAYSTQSDTLPTALFQNSGKGRFVLEAGCAHRIREMTLAINVTVTGGSARLAAQALWAAKEMRQSHLRCHACCADFRSKAGACLARCLARGRRRPLVGELRLKGP